MRILNAVGIDQSHPQFSILPIKEESLVRLCPRCLVNHQIVYFLYGFLRFVKLRVCKCVLPKTQLLTSSRKNDKR